MPVKRYYIIAAVLFAIYFLNGIAMIPRLSVTGDEGDHLQYAMRFAKMHPEKIRPFDDASTMPISVVNTFPRAAQQLIHPNLKKTDGGVSDIVAGRYMTLLVAALIGFYILLFTSELFGKKAALFSLFLFVFCPNINAHAVLVTTDAYSALFTLTSAWYFRKAIMRTQMKYTLLFGFHLGMAQLAKQSLTHLYIIFFLLAIIYFIRYKKTVNTKRVAAKIISAGLVVLLVINAGFLFKGTGTPLKHYQFRSVFFNKVQDQLSFASNIPLPFPEPYISGLDLTKNIDEIGTGHPENAGSAYILGKRKDGTGFWYYYFVVLFFKTPIPVIILFLLFCYLLLRRRLVFNDTSFVFLFTISYFLIYFNFFYNSQVGIRHIIMIYPLLYVLLGQVYEVLLKRKWIIPFLSVYSVATYYYFYPNLIAYSNEFIVNKTKAYKIMGDSNLDFGQGYYMAKKYLLHHPDTHFADTLPATGKQLIRVSDYLDLENEHKYEWIKKFTPSGQVAHSYLLFDIKPADIEKN